MKKETTVTQQPSTGSLKGNGIDRRRIICWTILLALHLSLALLFLFDRSPGTDAAGTGFPLDDAWIHLVYGRALSDSALPFYNDGALEAGFTSPLWMVVLALAELIAGALAISTVYVVKVFGVAIAFMATLAIYEIGRKLTHSSAMGCLTGLLAAACPPFAFSQVSGMEIPLAAAASLWAIFVYLEGRVPFTGILLALAYLARPEMATLTAVLLLNHLMLRTEPRRGRKVRESMRLILPSFLVFALWGGYCLIVSGHPLPNTFYQKFSSVGPIKNFGRVIKEIVLAQPAGFLYSGLALYFVGLVFLVARSRRAGIVLAIFPWAFLLSLAFSRFMPPGSGTYFYWLRYAVPVLPSMMIPVGLGAYVLWNLTKLRNFRSWTRIIEYSAKGLAVLLLSLAIVRYPEQIAFRKSQFAWNCQNINEVQVEMGRWVSRNGRAESAVVVNDAGAIRYFGKRPTIDLIGLNNHRLLFDRNLSGQIRRDPEALARFMNEAGADYLIIFPSWFPQLVTDRSFQNYFTPAIYFRSPTYTVVGAAQDLMVAFQLKSRDPAGPRGD